MQAAAGLFAAQGYSGATTRAIAEAAGVNELTLFRHFETKKNLFMQVVGHYSPLPEMARLLAERLSGDPRQDLVWIGRYFLGAILERRAAVLMTLYEAERFPEVRSASAQVPRQQRDLLAGYLRAQMERGYIRKADANMLAQAFLGIFFAYAIQRSLFEEPPLGEQELKSVVELYVEIFLDGVAAP
jgi:AcrR family transcriptional regulator